MSKNLSVAQAARSLGITLDAVYRLCKAGKLTSRKRKNGTWLIPAGAITDRKVAKARRARRQQRKKAA